MFLILNISILTICICADTWQELLVVLFECTKAPSAELRESAFRILHSVPSLITDRNTDILKSIFMASLNDASSKEVFIIVPEPGKQRVRQLSFDFWAMVVN